MKAFCSLLVLLLAATISRAETISAEVKDDSVIIHNSEAYEHCGFSVVFDVVVNDDVITIVERDTMLDFTTCYCYFDFALTLTGLETGSYTVKVYRKWSASFMPDTLVYIGSTEFSFEPQNALAYSETGYRSGCYTIDDLEEREQTIRHFDLLPNYPNPFNPQTVIPFNLPQAGPVNVAVYDVSGRLVRTLLNDALSAGSHHLLWNGVNDGGKAMPAGIYFVRLTQQGHSLTRKMVLLP